MESLNRWEKTTSLYQTASGVDISDGILEATVLEHSPENYQNILKREYAQTLRRYDGTSGSSSHQTQSTGPVPMEVDKTRAVSNPKVRARARIPKAKAKANARAREARRARIRSRWSTLPRILRVLRCEKWRHKRAGCGKRTADGKSKGGAAAASADNDGEVAAVMEASMLCAAVGSTGSLLLDSGSDEHLCTPKFADLLTTGPDCRLLKRKDVQQNDLTISGQKTVPMLVGPTGGKQAMEATATFRVAEARDNILSLVNLVRKGFSFTVGAHCCSMEKDGRSVPIYLERKFA